jgi:hypothetical protein
VLTTMRRPVVVAGVSSLLAATLAGCSSSSNSTKLSAGHPSLPASSPAAPTPAAPQGASTSFTSSYSPLPGLRLTWPTPGWVAIDEAAEVIARPPGLRGASLHVAKGLYPAGPDGGFLTTRPSAVAVIDALRSLPALQTSKPVRESIGHGLALIHVDVRLSPSAPRSGFQYLSYKGSFVTGVAYMIKPGMSVRVYAGVFRQPYGHEILDVVASAPSGKTFARWTVLAERAVKSLRLPKGLVLGGAVYD